MDVSCFSPQTDYNLFIVTLYNVDRRARLANGGDWKNWTLKANGKCKDPGIDKKDTLTLPWPQARLGRMERSFRNWGGTLYLPYLVGKFRKWYAILVSKWGELTGRWDRKATDLFRLIRCCFRRDKLMQECYKFGGSVGVGRVLFAAPYTDFVARHWWAFCQPSGNQSRHSEFSSCHRLIWDSSLKRQELFLIWLCSCGNANFWLQPVVANWWPVDRFPWTWGVRKAAIWPVSTECSLYLAMRSYC